MIPQTNPGANCQKYRARIDAAIGRVLDRGWYVLGEEVAAFEREFADFVGTRHALGVGNGTDALVVALRILGVGPGDAVFTVSHTAVATVAAIELTGAIPVLLDVDPVSYTLDVPAFAAVLAAWRERREMFGGAQPKAVVPVHLYGHPADMPAIVDLAREHGLAVVEDCAQAHGAVLDNRPVGTWGDVATFSFYPTKNLSAIGDGGAVCFDQDAYRERGAMLREYGWKQRQRQFPGMNYPLDELQAAILRVKLTGLAEDNRRRRAIASRYDAALADVVATPQCRAGQAIEHVYHQYVVRHARRDALQRYLREEHAIATLVHYPQPVHRQPAYSQRCLTAGRELKTTECLCGEILSLPIFPELADADVERICAAVRQFAMG